MSKLLKYEFRRSRIFVLEIAGISIILNAIFLVGWAFEIGILCTLGLLGEITCIAFGSTAVLIFSVINFNEDISKRQGYLLFSIPRSSKQVLGAKLLMTLFTFAGLTILFAILIFTDCAYAAYHYGENIIGFLRELFFDTSLTGEELYKTLFIPYNIFGMFMYLFDYIFSFLCKVVLAYIAIVLTKTLLGNSKGRILLAFVMWCGVSFILCLLASLITTAFNFNTIEETYTVINAFVSLTSIYFSPAMYLPALLINLAACVGGFFLVDWLVDKKLSL